MTEEETMDAGALAGPIRAAITNAYYDARNAGWSMETAADNAQAAVLSLLAAARGPAAPAEAEPSEDWPEHEPDCPMFEHPNDRTAPACICRAVREPVAEAEPPGAHPYRGNAFAGRPCLDCGMAPEFQWHAALAQPPAPAEEAGR